MSATPPTFSTPDPARLAADQVEAFGPQPPRRVCLGCRLAFASILHNPFCDGCLRSKTEIFPTFDVANKNVFYNGAACCGGCHKLLPVRLFGKVTRGRAKGLRQSHCFVCLDRKKKRTAQRRLAELAELVETAETTPPPAEPSLFPRSYSRRRAARAAEEKIKALTDSMTRTDAEGRLKGGEHPVATTLLRPPCHPSPFEGGCDAFNQHHRHAQFESFCDSGNQEGVEALCSGTPFSTDILVAGWDVALRARHFATASWLWDKHVGAWLARHDTSRLNTLFYAAVAANDLETTKHLVAGFPAVEVCVLTLQHAVDSDALHVVRWLVRNSRHRAHIVFRLDFDTRLRLAIQRGAHATLFWLMQLMDCRLESRLTPPVLVWVRCFKRLAHVRRAKFVRKFIKQFLAKRSFAKERAHAARTKQFYLTGGAHHKRLPPLGPAPLTHPAMDGAAPVFLPPFFGPTYV